MPSKNIITANDIRQKIEAIELDSEFNEIVCSYFGNNMPDMYPHGVAIRLVCIEEKMFSHQEQLPTYQHNKNFIELKDQLSELPGVSKALEDVIKYGKPMDDGDDE